MIQDTSLWANAQATQNLGKKQREALDALRFLPDAGSQGSAGPRTCPSGKRGEWELLSSTLTY